MLTARTNQEWLATLAEKDSQQPAALIELREMLLRAALYTLVTHLDDLSGIDETQRVALAEDCAQEALQAVLSRLDTFRGESKFTTWAYKFGVHVTLSRMRRLKWKTVSLEALSQDEDSLNWLQWKENLQTNDSEMPLRRAEVIAVVRQVIQEELTRRQREVLKWIAFDNVPMDVVVERLGTNRNAIYKMLHDARLKVKRGLAAQGFAIEDVYELFQAG